MSMTAHPPGRAAIAADNLLVVETYAVPRPSDRKSITHYEIHLAADAEAPRLCLLTRDEALYQRAARVEGKETRVCVRYHAARYNGDKCRVLDAIEVCR